MNSKSIIKEELPNVFCMLCIVGYPLSQCLLSPFGEKIANSAIMSWGYHIFSLFIASLTLWIFRKNEAPRNTSMVLTVFFFILYAIRAFYDLELGRDHLSYTFAYKLQYNSFSQLRFQTYVYIFLLTIFQLFVFSKVLNKINLYKVGKWIAELGFFSLLLTSIFYTRDYSVERIDGNATLNTISLANFSSAVCLCSLWLLFQGKTSFIHKLFFCFVIAFSINISLKTASRGPLLSLAVCLGLSALLFFKQKNPILVSTVLIAFLLCYFLMDYEEFLANRFPLLYNRLDRDNRTEVYSIYWNEFLRNKAFGFQLDFLGYSHNMIIDSFMMFGIIGGLIVPIICLNILFLAFMSRNNESIFLGITLVFFYMICNMFSGSLGTNLAFWSTYLIVANTYYNKKTIPAAINSNELISASP